MSNRHELRLLSECPNCGARFKIPALWGDGVVALIGESGCGKSTLAKLIAGLYQLQSGNIRIGMYTDLALDCFCQQVILIPQEPRFWSRSIWANFRLGAPHATFEEIVNACQLARIDDFISKLLDKYQTVLGLEFRLSSKK